MDEYRLQFKKKISKKRAIDKICAYAMYGKHSNVRPKSKREVLHYFLKRGYNIDQLVEECRDPTERIPEFENILGSTWEAVGDVALVDKRNGEEIAKMKGTGKFIWSTYESHFEQACNARDRAVKENSYTAFLECLALGFASIDAFFNTQAIIWNKQHPDDRLIDTQESRVNIETKLGSWLSKLSGGGRLKKDGRIWSEFKSLKKLRDDNAIHPKSPGYAIPYEQLAKHINTFRYGVAFLHCNIHRLLRIGVPAVIINGAYAPDVEVINIS